MGGFFTNSMACQHPDWFRAFAPVAGGGPGSCANANAKPPIIIHHGTADPIVEFKSGEATRDFWTEQNGCDQTTTSKFMGCQSYGACSSPVLFCVGNEDHTISSTAAGNIMNFFNEFQ
jgi:poly(3-hydroxybutyrate) depolymerase